MPVLTGTVVGLTGAAAAALSIMCGVSDVCYTSGNYKAAEKSLQWKYNGAAGSSYESG